MAKHLYRGDCPDASQPNSRDQECEACREEDELRKDAERYRWLRSDGRDISVVRHTDFRETETLLGDEIDIAIDAAMNGANAAVKPRSEAESA